MSTEEVLTWIIQNLIPILCIGSVLIQITPIKWNPITSFVKWFGKIITNDLTSKVETLTKTVYQIQDQVMVNEKDRIRWEVLDFANSCRNGRRHTRDEYVHIMTLNDKYRALLEQTHDRNGVFEEEYEYIKRLYHERLEKNDFL